MKTLFAAVLLAAICPLASCKMFSGSSEDRIECVCGTDEAALEGCASACCMAGETDPNNPDCLCGPLSFE